MYNTIHNTANSASNIIIIIIIIIVVVVVVVVVVVTIIKGALALSSSHVAYYARSSSSVLALEGARSYRGAPNDNDVLLSFNLLYSINDISLNSSAIAHAIGIACGKHGHVCIVLQDNIHTCMNYIYIYIYI